ncbi:hypothetical protein ACH4MA_10435 [Streptomyces roseolus]|uniref:hypothetical protein n=1 Tax=Streptomyces roseolus TaxID=67358 RepID=UPI0037B9BC28
MKRILPLSVAAAAAVLGMAAPAQAHDTDDWNRVDSWTSGLRSRTTQDTLADSVGQGKATIRWNDSLTRTEVQAGASDWVNDGWCVATQLRYQVDTGGGWSQHYHYRVPAVDCDIDDGAKTSPLYRNNYPIKVRNLEARVCLAYSDGRTAPVTNPCRDWS